MKQKTKTPEKVWAIVHEVHCYYGTPDFYDVKADAEGDRNHCRQDAHRDRDRPTACRIVAYVPEKKDK